MVRLAGAVEKSSARAKEPSALSSAWCTFSTVALVWASMSSLPAFPSLTPATLTQPRGPITSFTKEAVSLIIGPLPASYQPTEPSAQLTCRQPSLDIPGTSSSASRAPIADTRTGFERVIWHITST